MTNPPAFDDATIRETILALLLERGPGKTICPSEAARALGGKDEKIWRHLMKPVRRISVGMAHDGIVEIRRKGRRVDPDDFRGVYRLGLPNVGDSFAGDNA